MKILFLIHPADYSIHEYIEVVGDAEPVALLADLFAGPH